MKICGMRTLVIWAHSACRSTVPLLKEAKRLAETKGWHVVICEWGVKPIPPTRCEKWEEVIHVGDDLARGRKVLSQHGGPTSVQVFCVYQNSAVWRKLIVEAKRGGSRVVVNAEAPCEMCLGVRAWMKRAYYQWILPWRLHGAIKAADMFISSSGKMGIDRLLRLGWPRAKIVPFGYASARLENKGGESREHESRDVLHVLHLGIEAPYRGVEIAEQAAQIAEVKLMKTGGRLSQTDLVAAIRSADIVVGCGYCEPWGMRMNDALLEGVPVIVSDGMGVSVVCEWYGCGCVVPKGNVNALATVLKQCQNDREFLTRLKSGAQRAAKELLPMNRAKLWLEYVIGEKSGLEVF